VVIGHTTRLPASEARDLARYFFKEVLLRGSHPARAVAIPSTPGSFAWMTPVVFSSVPPDGWSGGLGRPVVVPPDLGLRLDRDPQRSIVLKRVRDHLIQGNPRTAGLACLATGGDREAVDHLGAVLEQDVGRSWPVVRLPLSKPSGPQTTEAWEGSLREALRVDGGPLKSALRLFLEDRYLRDNVVIVLDFGAHASPPLELRAWVELCRAWARALVFSDTVRLLFVYGLVADLAEHDRLDAELTRREFAPDTVVRPELLQRLEDLRHGELLRFLQDHGHELRVDPQDTERAADEVFQRLRRGNRAPYALLLRWIAQAVVAGWRSALGLDASPEQEPSTIGPLM
jgi:hypothetical protein